MGIFYRRYLAKYCAIFAVASLCGCFLEFGIKVVLTVMISFILTFLLLLSIFIKKHRSKLFNLFLCFIFALLAFASPLLRNDIKLKNTEKYFDNDVELTGIITEKGFSADFTSSYTVDVYQINNEDCSLRALLEFDYDAMLEVGSTISGTFTVNSIDNRIKTPQYQKSNGIFLYLVHASGEIEQTEGKLSAKAKFSILNQRLSDMLCDEVIGEAGRFISALILGNDDLMSNETVRDFRRSGLSHVTAISGMHLSVLMFFLDVVLIKLRIKKKYRGGIVFLAALFYLALTGFGASALRAFIMNAVVYFGFLLKEDSDTLTNLFFALFLIIFIFPFSVYDIGLWMSFLAVLGIFTASYFIEAFSEYLYKKEKPKSKYKKTMNPYVARMLLYLVSSSLITVFANIFILIPAWLFFGELSLVSVIANILIIPLASLLLYVTPLFILTSKIKILSFILGYFLKIICNIIFFIVDVITSFGKTTVSLNYPLVGIIIFVMSAAILACLILRLKRKWVVCLPPLIACVLFGGCIWIYNVYHSGFVSAEYVRHGESEMLLIQDANEYAIIDMSSGAYTYAYDAFIRSSENCATEISSYVVTHYHERHINTINKISRSFILNNLYLPYPQDKDEFNYMIKIINSAVSANVNIIIFDRNEEINITKNTELSLSLAEDITRSTHKVFYYTLNTKENSIAYISESAWEAFNIGSKLESAIEDSSCVIFGIHGPIIKVKADYSEHLESKLVIFASDTLKNSLSNEDISALSNVSHINIKLK